MRHAWDSYRLLLVWHVLRYRSIVVFLAVMQVVLAVGVIYGLAFLIPHLDRRTALYLATGAPTLTLLIMGLNVVPQEIAQAKISGRFEYVAALPVPRLASLAADVTFWLMAQLPGTALALVAASLRFHIVLHPRLTMVPAVLLVAFSGASVGYALGAVLRPELTGQLTSFISIAVLLFSPVNFPLSRLPGALQAIHRVLPVTYMADLVRGSLAGGMAVDMGLAFAVVAAWCLGGLGLSYLAAARRR